jgi:hypothetical protein
MGVVACALLSSAAINLLLILIGLALQESRPFTTSEFVWAAVIVGAVGMHALCVPPWLCLETRNGLAGTVFALSIPFALMTGAELIASSRQWLGGRLEVQTVQLTLGVIFLVVIWVCGFVLGYRKWLRFEAVDTVPGAWSLPVPGSRTRSETAIRRPSATLALLGKELRLHSANLVIAALFFGAWLIELPFRHGDLGQVGEWLVPSIVVYGCVIALLTGSLACAEERQLGTLEWQLTLPVSPRWQWLVKATTAFVVSQLFAAVVPFWFLHLAIFDQVRTDFMEKEQGLLLLSLQSVSLTALALYTSSVCRSTVRAFLVATSFAVVLGGGAVFLGRVLLGQGAAVFLAVPLSWLLAWLDLSPADLKEVAQANAPLLPLLFPAYAFLFGWLAFGNYRRADTKGRRVAIHILGVSALILMTEIAWLVLMSH